LGEIHLNCYKIICKLEKKVEIGKGIDHTARVTKVLLRFENMEEITIFKIQIPTGI
jgi:hypothetical protein